MLELTYDRLLTIDPGVHRHALARGDGEELEAVWFADAGAVLAMPVVAHVTIENPRIGRQTRGKDPNDQMDLAVAVGELKGVFLAKSTPVELLTPSEWKGSIKKPLHHWKVWSVLRLAERRRFAEGAAQYGRTKTPADIEAKIRDACLRLKLTGEVSGYSWAAHNLLDAAGLFLFKRGRIGRAGQRHGVFGA
jgi:hypothetical protein